MLRLIITVIFVVLFLVLSIPLFLIEWIIGKFNTNAKDRSSLAIVQCAFKIVMVLSGVKVTYLGEENIPTDHAVVFIGNHRGFFDVVTAYSHVKGLTGFISKKEMLKVPLLRVWMRYLHCLFLDRNDIKAGLKTILQAIESVKNGISIFIFPEGTRSKEPDTFLPFHEGSFKIATKAGCPIIPVTFNNTSAVLEDHFPKIKKTHVIVEFGKPIYMENLDADTRKHLAPYVQQIIMDTYFKNKELV